MYLCVCTCARSGLPASGTFSLSIACVTPHYSAETAAPPFQSIGCICPVPAGDSPNTSLSVHRLFPVMLNYRPLFSRHNLVLLSRPSLLRLRADARPVLQASFISISKMERELDSIPHVDRTANEPRDPTLHSLSLAKIDRINPTTRLFKLRASGDGVKVSGAS